MKTHSAHKHNHHDLAASNYHDKSFKWEITKIASALNNKKINNDCSTSARGDWAVGEKMI